VGGFGIFPAQKMPFYLIIRVAMKFEKVIPQSIKIRITIESLFNGEFIVF